MTHRAFRTATLKGTDFHLDVASARAESYRRPGALPTVRPGTLRDDLSRRDFTVNAIALGLTGEYRSAIIDPFGGRADLQAKLLRVLHEASFQDDSTRILRSARYESRLEFRLEPRTLRWLRRDVRYLDAISAARIRQEIIRTLREPEPEGILLRLQSLGALRPIHPALSFDRRRAAAFARIRDIDGASAVAYLALLSWPLSRTEASALASRLALTRRETDAVRAAPIARAMTDRLSRRVKPSRAVEALSTLPTPAAWAMAAAGPVHTKELALCYLRRWRHVKPSLDGHDLLAMGATEGPRLGEVLRRLKAAKLDGEVRTRRDEQRLARRLLGLSASK